MQTNRGVYISLPIVRKLINDANPESQFIAIQLIGSSWNQTNGLANIGVGFTNEATMETVQNWMTTDLIASIGGVWATGVTAKEKSIKARFTSGGATGVSFEKGGSTAGTRTGDTSIVNSVQNDVLIFYLSRTMNFTLELRRAPTYSTVQTTGTLAHPDGTISRSNFNTSPLVPCFATWCNTTGFELKVLSKRDTDGLGITVTNGVNIFA